MNTHERRRLACHCLRTENELAIELLPWQLQHGTQTRRHPAKTYIIQLRDDTDLLIIDYIKMAIKDRERYQKYVMHDLLTNIKC